MARAGLTAERVTIAGAAPADEVGRPSALAEATTGRAGRDAVIAFATAWREYAHKHPGRYMATRTPILLEHWPTSREGDSA